MDTDILGVQLGFHTVLVLSGGMSRADLHRYAYHPELVVDSIADLHQLLEKRRWQPWWKPGAHLPRPQAQPPQRHEAAA
jgi:NagD protein